MLAWAVLHPLHAMDSSGLVVPFTEEAIPRGINYVVVEGDFGDGEQYGCGIGWIDLDDDGDVDLVCVGGPVGKVGIFENDGSGHFTERTRGSGLPLLDRCSGVSAADYDGDMDLDLLITRWHHDSRLFRNDGGFTFTDVSLESGISGHPGAGMAASWGDVDGDGWIDLYICHRTGSDGDMARNLMFMNNGNGTFTETAQSMGIDHAGATIQSILSDLDRDGDLDLYLSTDKGSVEGHSNELFRNDGGVFSLVEGSNADVVIDSMGVAVGDFDRNGFLDIYCTNVPSGNPLLMNLGDMVFFDAAGIAGVESFSTGWGTRFVDFDNDNDLDLWVCNMMNHPDRLYLNDGPWPCMDVASQAGVENQANSYGLAFADIDDDGDLDAAVTNHEGRVRLFINHHSNLNHSMRLRIIGSTTGNTHAIGSMIEAHMDGILELREISISNNYKSQDELLQHLGMGDLDAIDMLQVQWPGGDPIRTLRNLPANGTWTIYPPALLGDFDGDGIVAIEDVVAFISCNETGFTPGCEMMDLDGDSVIGNMDFQLLLRRYEGPLDDCNDNGTLDLEEIYKGSATDLDGDGIIDDCQSDPADLDGDGLINGIDLGILLAEWGACVGCSADLDASGFVDGGDLAMLLAAWSR